MEMLSLEVASPLVCYEYRWTLWLLIAMSILQNGRCDFIARNC
jgi:hypothetical protein